VATYLIWPTYASLEACINRVYLTVYHSR